MFIHEKVEHRGDKAHLDNLNKLVDARAAGEDGRPDEQLGEHAALRPHVDGRVVVRGPEDQLGCAVEPRADVGHVGLALDEGLGGPEVAQLQHLAHRIHQQVMGLDVSARNRHNWK